MPNTNTSPEHVEPLTGFVQKRAAAARANRGAKRTHRCSVLERTNIGARWLRCRRGAFAFGQNTHDKLEQLRDLLAHKIPNGDLAQGAELAGPILGGELGVDDAGGAIGPALVARFWRFGG